MWRVTFTLGYLSSAIVLSPCAGAADSAPKRLKRPAEVTLSEFVQTLKDQGEVTQFTAVLAKLTGFPPIPTKKTFEAQATETRDGVGRIASIVFSESSAGGATPLGLYWNTWRETGRTSEAFFYRTALDGSLKKAVRVDGQLDENGRAVRGAARPTELDAQDGEVRERFQREVLDFWLKGKGRRKRNISAPARKPQN